jgi:hypothetical protein
MESDSLSRLQYYDEVNTLSCLSTILHDTLSKKVAGFGRAVTNQYHPKLPV